MEEEKKNRQKSLYLSLGIHGALLLLFFFLLAWKEPFPPIPEYGIELNFGTDNQGSGTTEQPIVASPTPANQSSEDQNEEEVPDSGEEKESQVTPDQPASEKSQPEPSTDQPAEDQQSPDVVQDTKETQPGDEDSKKTPPITADTTPDEKGKKETDASAGASQGDDTNKAGDKGEPEGKIDERALYGNPGAGGGASLNMSGWTWDYIPKPNDRSQENGRIVFSITIDDAGEILSIRTLEKTVTPAVERIYKTEVEKLTFSTTSDNTVPATTSTGTITFIIKTN